MRFLVERWEMKLVAVVVAVALHTYTSGQVRVERTITVAVSDTAVRGLPLEFQVTDIEPREFKVQLSVPENQLDEVDQGLTPRLEVEADQLAAGVATFPLTSHTLRLPNDIRIISTEPADLRELTVRVDRIAEADLPVELPRLVGLPPGLAAEVVCDPTLVHIRAPSTVVDRLVQEHYRVRFQEMSLQHVAADLGHESKETAILVPLPAPAEMPFKVVGQVEATALIRPLPGNRKSLTVPLQILAQPELLRAVRVEIAQPRLIMEVRGPENLLRDLSGERDITAWVAVNGTLEAGLPHQLPIQVHCPEGITVDDALAPATVTLVPLTGDGR